MKVYIIMSLMVGFGRMSTNSLFTRCKRREEWKKMDKIGKLGLEGESSMYFVKSRTDCFEKCKKSHACKSFGIDMDKLKCYLYDFYVWSGGRVIDDGSSLVYYWLFQESCPVEYTYNGNLTFCYRFYTDVKNWTAAMNHCIEDGSHLTFADTDAKYEAILKVTGSRTAFLGSTDEQTEGLWTWLNGENVVNNWNSNEPDNWNGKEHCIIIYNTGFIDTECRSTRAYVCEIPVIN